jgi:hypothetical protein
MGLLTLAQLRAEVSAILGTRSGLANARIDQWINFGYQDVVSSVEFDELTSLEALNPSGFTAPVPDGALVVSAVRSGTRLLTWLPQTEWIRNAPDATGETKHWTRIGNTIYFSPVTGTLASNLEALVIKSVTPLTTDGSTTEIPESWDLAVLMLAISFGFSALDELEAGTVWYNRALAYMQGRAIEEKRKLIRPGLGATVRPDLRIGVT